MPTEKLIDVTDLKYYHDQVASPEFASQADLGTLEQEVQELITEGGEPNTIETVKVNGTALVPDAQKAVDVTVPTSTSDLTNDGDGQSNFATESYVQQNGGKIDVIKVNGTAQAITAKAVDIAVPTEVSDLTNDSGFQTASDVSSAIAAAVGDITSFEYQVVQSLPATGEAGVVYLVPKSSAGTSNAYDEYIYVSNGFEKIGDTEIDLSGYWDKATYTIATTAEIDAIFA